MIELNIKHQKPNINMISMIKETALVITVKNDQKKLPIVSFRINQKSLIILYNHVFFFIEMNYGTIFASF